MPSLSQYSTSPYVHQGDPGNEHTLKKRATQSCPKAQISGSKGTCVCRLSVFLLTLSHVLRSGPRSRGAAKETSKEPLMNHCWSVNWPKSILEGFIIILKCTNPTVALLSIYPSKQNTLSCVHILNRKKVHLYYGMLNNSWKESAELYTDPAQYTDWILLYWSGSQWMENWISKWSINIPFMYDKKAVQYVLLQYVCRVYVCMHRYVCEITSLSKIQEERSRKLYLSSGL